jgi:VanZ family protein
MMSRALVKNWLPVLLWMLFIFIGSTDLMSAEHTSRFIGPFLRWFAPDITETTIGSIQLFVRKCAHLTEYAILAALLFRALRQGRNHLWRVAALAFVISAICAALDEFHQSFVASRTGSPWDVMIDCGGALVGLAIYARVWLRRVQRAAPRTR